MHDYKPNLLLCKFVLLCRFQAGAAAVFNKHESLEPLSLGVCDVCYRI